LGDAIAVTSNATPFVLAYPWSSSGFGTKYANPTTLPGGFGKGVAFSPLGDAIAVGFGGASPYLRVYRWSSATGFGAAYSNPATLPAGTVNNIAFTA
jgi:hypothetical protein